MSIILALLGTMVLFVTPIAVELSVCTGLHGCGHPMLMRVWRWGTISRAAMNNAASSASAAEAMTNLMIVAMVNIAPLKRGIGSSSER
jgi:hypothetical protein